MQKLNVLSKSTRRETISKQESTAQKFCFFEYMSSEISQMETSCVGNEKSIEIIGSWLICVHST